MYLKIFFIGNFLITLEYDILPSDKEIIVIGNNITKKSLKQSHIDVRYTARVHTNTAKTRLKI